MGNETSEQKIILPLNSPQEIPIISELHHSFHPDKLSPSPLIAICNDTSSSGTEEEGSFSPSFDPFAEFLTTADVLKTSQDNKQANSLYLHIKQKIYSEKDDSEFYKCPTYNKSVQQEEEAGSYSPFACITSTCLKEVKEKESNTSKNYVRQNGIKPTVKVVKQSFARKEMHFTTYDEESSYKVLMGKNKALNDSSLITHLLNTLTFIKDIDKEHSIELIEDLQYVLFESEAQLMKENSFGTSVFFIIKGKVKLTTTTQKTILKMLTGPVVLGERIFLNDSIRQWDVYAHTPVYAYVLTKHKIKAMQQYIQKTIDPTTNRLYLNQCPVFNLLSTEQKDKLSQYMHRELYGNNRVIINQYDKPNTLYIFISGTAEKTIYNYKKNTVVSQLKPGDVFAYSNLIYPKQTPISVISIKPSICLSICFDSLKSIFDVEDYHLSLRNLFIKVELQKNKFFSGIYSQMDNRLLNNFIIKHYASNEIVIPTGTALSEGVYIVLEGDVYKESDTRVKLKERFGSILFSEHVYANKHVECETNIRASTDCFIAQITKTVILFHLGQSFDKLTKMLIRRTALQKSKAFSVFQGTKTFLDDLCNHIDEVHFKQGEIIYNEADEADKAYFIQNGKITITKNYIEQSYSNNSFAGLSSLTSLLNKDKISLLDNGVPLKRNEKAVADRATDCLLIEREKYVKSFKDSNSNQLLLYITKRLYYAENKFDIEKMFFYPLFESSLFTRGMPFLAKISYFEEQITFCKAYSKFYYVDDQQMLDLTIILPILQSVDSNFIAKLVSALITEEQIYFLYAYIAGNTLESYIDAIPSCSYDLVRIWGMQLLLAIKALHSKKIMHRTINSENVLIDSNGNVCLKQLNKVALYPIKNENLTVSTDIRYLAPEMLYGHNDYKLSVDFWAFGVLLYLLICKTYPFGKNELDQKKVIGAIINDDFTFPSFVLDEQFKDLICGLLNKSEEKRLKTYEKIKDHPFFSKLSSRKIEKLKVKVPLKEIKKPFINAFGNVKYFTFTDIQEKMAFNLKMKNNSLKRRCVNISSI